jgi:hypothetical protein
MPQVGRIDGLEVYLKTNGAQLVENSVDAA